MNVGKTLQVLDLGYVRLIDVMGSDLSVVNAARASFAKESDTLTDKDAKLIRYLATNNHTSPFRHAFIAFEVKAPLMVARQMWKHVVGSDHTMDAWNEASRRYVTMLEEFYVPVFRNATADKKQGSDGIHEHSDAWQVRLVSMQKAGLQMYEVALADGVAPELARGFLPSDFQYVTWRWSSSLQSVAHFLTQRLDAHAQWEIQRYAEAVHEIAAELFPVSIQALGVRNE
jgi:thymidylate synthase (FAD)